MLRNLRAGFITRRTRPVTRFNTLRPIRVHSVSFVSFRTSPQVATLGRNISPFIRRFSSTTVPDDPDLDSELAFPEWIDADRLEEVAQAPWLPSVPEDHQERFRRAYVLLLYIVMYLQGPNVQGIEKDEAEARQFITVFKSASVSPESDIGRARRAVGILTKTVTEDISTIPALASVRTQHPQVFAHAEQLVPFCEKHLEGLTQDTVALSGEIVREGKWQDFWSKAGLPVGLLLQELGKEGYSIFE